MLLLLNVVEVDVEAEGRICHNEAVAEGLLASEAEVGGTAQRSAVVEGLLLSFPAEGIVAQRSFEVSVVLTGVRSMRGNSSRGVSGSHN